MPGGEGCGEGLGSAAKRGEGGEGQQEKGVFMRWGGRRVLIYQCGIQKTRMGVVQVLKE